MNSSSAFFVPRPWHEVIKDIQKPELTRRYLKPKLRRVRPIAIDDQNERARLKGALKWNNPLELAWHLKDDPTQSRNKPHIPHNRYTTQARSDHQRRFF
jgi:hypothetical protein